MRPHDNTAVVACDSASKSENRQQRVELGGARRPRLRANLRHLSWWWRLRAGPEVEVLSVGYSMLEL